jgi:Uma2 family endonuclease
MAITQLSQLDLNGTYSYADYLTWEFEETVELIKGKIMLMCPAPNLKHQRISRKLSHYIDNFLYKKHKKSCELFVAPFDVKLNESIVQPDLCVVCDKSKLTEQGCNGAPDWIIEVLSKGNSKKEMRSKYALYEEHGVIEYWLVYPYEQAVYQFVLNDQTRKYHLMAMYAGDEMASSFIFPDLKIDLTEIFSE